MMNEGLADEPPRRRGQPRLPDDAGRKRRLTGYRTLFGAEINRGGGPDSLLALAIMKHERIREAEQ